jgi:hypothetical protein
LAIFTIMAVVADDELGLMSRISCCMRWDSLEIQPSTLQPA